VLPELSKNEKTPPKATKPRVGPVDDRLDLLTIHPKGANRQQTENIFLGKKRLWTVREHFHEAISRYESATYGRWTRTANRLLNYAVDGRKGQ